MLQLAFAGLGFLALAGTAEAQHAPPYAGMQGRQIKALSEREVVDLRAGRGMGLALAAELNGYPGPLHVIELADPLGLSADQLASVRALHGSMKAEAVPLGDALIRREAELDGLFAAKSVTPERLASATREIGAAQAELRNAHLKYHLATVAILTPDQVRRYGELRGYASAAPAHSRQPH